MSIFSIIVLIHFVSVIPIYIAIIHYLRKLFDVTYSDLIGALVIAVLPFFNLFILLTFSGLFDKPALKQYDKPRS